MNEAVTTTLFPAPEKIIYLTVCNCKTICVSLRCKSAKSDLDCSELCQCDGCQNDKKDEFFKVEDQDIEVGYEYWIVTMKNTALKTLTMKLLVLGKTCQLRARVEIWHGRNTAYGLKYIYYYLCPNNYADFSVLPCQNAELSYKIAHNKITRKY